MYNFFEATQQYTGINKSWH